MANANDAAESVHQIGSGRQDVPNEGHECPTCHGQGWVNDSGLPAPARDLWAEWWRVRAEGLVVQAFSEPTRFQIYRDGVMIGEGEHTDLSEVFQQALVRLKVK